MVFQIKRVVFYLILFSFFTCKNANNIIDDTTVDIEDFEKILIGKSTEDHEVTFEIKDSLRVLKYKSICLGNCMNGSYSLVHRGILSGNKISPHFNSYLIVYSYKGLKKGSYYLGSNDSLKLINNDLIIYGIGGCNQTTRISFRDSIPQKIFIHCKEENGKMFGDLYNFEKQN